MGRTSEGITSTGALVSSTDYAYDRLDRLVSVSSSAGAWGYEYNEVGLRTAVVNPNGTRTETAWDDRNRLTRLTTVNTLTSALINDFDYELDARGNRLAITDHADGSRFDYAYDEADRLVSEIRTGAVDAYARAFTLDAVGNRLTQVTTGHLNDNASYGYDANDRLQSVTDGAKVVTYAWDANGNQTEETDSLTGVTREFVWNDRDRLAAVFDDGAHVATYGYDHGANRVSREAGGVVTRFLVDLINLTGYSQVARETDAPAGAALGDPPAGPFAETVRYTYGDDLLAQIRADVLPTADPVSFYHYDGLGSVRALTDSLAGVANAYAYEAFGNLLASTPAPAAPINVYLYTGERLDTETGLYHLRARQMTPTIGRFIAPDAYSGFLERPETIQKYVYSSSGPVSQIDPTGLFTIPDISFASGIRAERRTSNIRSIAKRAFEKGELQYYVTLWLAKGIGGISQVPHYFNTVHRKGRKSLDEYGYFPCDTLGRAWGRRNLWRRGAVEGVMQVDYHRNTYALVKSYMEQGMLASPISPPMGLTRGQFAVWKFAAGRLGFGRYGAKLGPNCATVGLTAYALAGTMRVVSIFRGNK